jgi:hypothetical protein
MELVNRGLTPKDAPFAMGRFRNNLSRQFSLIVVFIILLIVVREER